MFTNPKAKSNPTENVSAPRQIHVNVVYLK